MKVAIIGLHSGILPRQMQGLIRTLLNFGPTKYLTMVTSVSEDISQFGKVCDFLVLPTPRVGDTTNLAECDTLIQVLNSGSIETQDDEKRLDYLHVAVHIRGPHIVIDQRGDVSYYGV